MAIASGAKLGPYEILLPLGSGGMGEVYRARDTRLGRDIALKVLPSEFASHPDRVMRFEQEARYASTRDLARDLQSLRDHFAEIASSGETAASFQNVKPRPSFLLLMVAIVALIAGVGLAYWYSNKSPHKLVVLRTLTYSGSDSSPAISPNEELVAFRSDRDGTPRIWLKQMQGGNEIAGDSPSAGEIMDIAGKGRIIMHSASLRENLREIKLRDLQNAASSSWLTRGNSANRQPSYFADGKRILFSSNMAANLDLWDLSTESRGLRRITEDAAEDWDPAYSPDGKYILWSSNRNGHFEIWIANNDGSSARRVTNDGVDAENPSMTPDGKWIVYNSYNPDLKIRGIWRIHPDRSAAERIVSGLTQWPEISPDGLYASYGFYKQSLNDRFTYERVVKIETGTTIPFEIEVSNRDRVGGRMRWMPDGKSIVFIDEDAKGNWGLFAQDFLSGKDTRATRRPIAGFDADRKIDTFAISPDGSKIVLAEVEVLSSLIMAEGVPGIEPSRHD